ncbi:EAL domain-containing protein [Xanthobacter sp. KR7-65]|uniref:bifunctional diguanylate cyclase/phosphodiesterase n=1 Tax=Xanthobacter sp. KR7-65 TaxID=3156612 RepID=UPI0032B3B0FC
MIWHRLKLIVVGGMSLLLLLLATGTALLLDRGETVAMPSAQTSLERSAQAVENALNRQLLQVHGALASLPNLFAAARVSPTDRPAAAELLRGLNFQTLAFRDLLLVGPDSAVLASARMRRANRSLPITAAALQREPMTLLGPVLNPITGDWSLYVARVVSGWNGVIPVAEVPIGTLMSLLSETDVTPGARILLERPDGQLIAALPHDEVQTGKVRPNALGMRPAGGKAFTRVIDGEEVLAVVRTSLYNEVRVVLAEPLDVAMAAWRRDRDRTTAGATLAGLAIAIFAATLFIALRQREIAEADRTRAAAVLANAVDAMSDGFAMWDPNDRLVTCNQPFRDLYPRAAPFMVPGARYEEIVRKGAHAGQFDTESEDVDQFVAMTLAWHRAANQPLERRLGDGRWVLMKESHTADGGTVAIRTDITALKTMVANLAEANARAKDAIEETRRQNEVLVEREGRIRFLAHHDDLTGLANRVLFRTQIQEALQTSRERDLRMALLYLDLDRFKDVNDTLGHPVGDALLRAVAKRLRACAGASECARLSGDEFAVISLAPTQPDEAEALSRAIIQALGRPFGILGHTISISVSIGLTVADDSNADADALLKQADLALYQAKGGGRGTVCIFAPEMDARLHARLQMEADLRQALAQRQFALAYQPVFSRASGAVCGFEGLLRWHHPRLGLIHPNIFIPLAEETGLIAEIGTWVVRRACADASLLPSHIKVAVNLSPVQLSSGNLLEVVGEALAANGLDGRRLELEITETALFAESERNRDMLQRLKDLGAAIVLDDFGTGYSSLSHLRVFALDKIKIDRSFVAEMAQRPDSAAIVEAIARLAGRLGIGATAEGIETAQQLAIACKVGCTELQGHYLGLPAPLEEAMAKASAMRLPPFPFAAEERPGDACAP